MKQPAGCTQLDVVFDSFKERPKTMKMVNMETDIMRENICRYVAILQEQGKIAVVKTGRCPITGYSGVNYYTTDPELFPARTTSQLSLFNI